VPENLNLMYCSFGCYCYLEQGAERVRVMRSKKALLVKLTIALVMAMSPLHSLAENKKIDVSPTKSFKRSLHFPSDKSIGMILIGNERAVFGSLHPYVQVSGAVGDVVVDVPTGQRVVFEANRRVWENPSCLDQVSAKGIDCIRLTFVSLYDEEDDLSSKPLAHMAHFQTLKEIDLTRADIVDASLSKLKNVRSLEGLGLQLSAINGSCFEQLAALPNLRGLWAQDCSLDQKNLRFLSRWPKLEELDLSRTHLTEAGTQYLAKCTGLKTLSICSNAKFDDKCLGFISELKNLEMLKVPGTAITLEGLKHLQKLHLRLLLVPASMTKDQSELARLFPHTTIICDSVRKQIDSDVMRTYAPLRH